MQTNLHYGKSIFPKSKKREINADTDIAQKFGAVELEEDFNTIEEHFGTNPTAKHIHIIVQMPTPPPATSTGCEFVIDIFNLFVYLVTRIYFILLFYRYNINIISAFAVGIRKDSLHNS